MKICRYEETKKDFWYGLIFKKQEKNRSLLNILIFIDNINCKEPEFWKEKSHRKNHTFAYSTGYQPTQEIKVQLF